ncbi:MAG TPA: hypothetical protein DDW23_03175 [Planctomycetes bacterium]|nr:hypothetical protein [Planctomycetota bacterium]
MVLHIHRTHKKLKPRLLILLGLAFFACTRAEEKVSVVLVSIDSLRADFCSPYGHVPLFAKDEQTTPFLQKLADEGVLFESCSAAAPWTLPSHVSILSGASPAEHGVRSRKFRMKSDLGLISEKFQDAGWATAGFFSAPFLHPTWGFFRGFDTYEPGPPYLDSLEAAEAMMQRGSRKIQDFHQQADSDKETTPDTLGKAKQWLEQGDKWKEPFFLFIHLWDPHYDYEPPAHYAQRFHPGYEGPVDGTGFNDDTGKWGPDDLDHFKALYEAEIRYTDDHLAAFFAQLQEWGLDNKVIFAVVSDHGDEFAEHGQLGHHKTLYEEVMRVPMIIRAPGSVPAGTRIKGTVSNYDLAPTLLDLAGLQPWSGKSGQSLRSLWETADASRDVLMDLLHPGRGLDLQGWRWNSHKAILDRRRGSLTMFDLAEDPGEHQPNAQTNSPAFPQKDRAMSFFQETAQRSAKGAVMEESAEMIRILEELGYTGG